MSQRYLTQTGQGTTRSLSVGRHQVHDSWDQIQAYLGASLSPAHAQVFAEPYRGPDATSWMAHTEAEPVPFARLAPEAQNAALARLDTLLADIARLSAERGASKSEEDRQWGALLDAICLQPAGVSLEERLFVAGDQPVLVQWGCRDEETVRTDAALRDLRAAPPPPPIRTGGTDRAVPLGAGPVLGEGVRGGRSWPAWLLPAILWLLFVLALLAILYWLLAACALRLPPAMQIVGNCPGQIALAPERARNVALLDELDRLRAGLTDTPQCEIAEAETWEVPAPRRAQAEPPSPPPVPDADPETDIDRAREEAGGTLGDVTVTLLWNGQSDLDLLIGCPSGAELAGFNSGSVGRCGGEIDVDANYCGTLSTVGAPCEGYVGDPVSNPVENAFFLTDRAEQGQYVARVRHYAAARDGPQSPVPFVLQVRRGDERERFEGTAMPGQTIDVTDFVID